MTEQLWLEGLRSLGIPGVLAALLWWLLRVATEERQRITDRFLLSMDKRADEDRAADERIAASLQVYQIQNTAEHHALLDAAKDLTIAIKELREEMRK